MAEEMTRNTLRETAEDVAARMKSRVSCESMAFASGSRSEPWSCGTAITVTSGYDLHHAVSMRWRAVSMLQHFLARFPPYGVDSIAECIDRAMVLYDAVSCNVPKGSDEPFSWDDKKMILTMNHVNSVAGILAIGSLTLKLRVSDLHFQETVLQVRDGFALELGYQGCELATPAQLDKAETSIFMALGGRVALTPVCDWCLDTVLVLADLAWSRHEADDAYARTDVDDAARTFLEQAVGIMRGYADRIFQLVGASARFTPRMIAAAACAMGSVAMGVLDSSSLRPEHMSVADWQATSISQTAVMRDVRDRIGDGFQITLELLAQASGIDEETLRQLVCHADAVIRLLSSEGASSEAEVPDAEESSAASMTGAVSVPLSERPEALAGYQSLVPTEAN